VVKTMPDDQQADDQHMAELLAVVLGGDDSGAPVDNSIIAKRLGWDLEAVAKCLNEAKERSLVWGQRSGDKPAPWFKELEITVQGRRLLRSIPAKKK
jgi:hypothetical protein